MQIALARIVNEALTTHMAQHIALPAPTARHPFRRRFAFIQALSRQRSDDQDIRLFALSFTAFFICIYTFIF